MISGLRFACAQFSILGTSGKPSYLEVILQFVLYDAFLIPSLKRFMEMTHCTLTFEVNEATISVLAEASAAVAYVLKPPRMRRTPK